MENKKLENGISEIKNISMTDLEKSHILENVFKFSTEREMPVKSPFSMYSLFSMLHKNQLVYYIIIPLIIILSTGGVVYASQESLPDSFLYPIKVNIVEPIEGVLAFSAESKIKHEIGLASTRMTEAEKLAEKDKLNPLEEKKINKLLEKHTVAIDKAISKIKKSKSNTEVDEIITDFGDKMNMHAQALDDITKENYNSKSKNVNNRISEKARNNADKIKNVLENKKSEIEKEEKDKEYQSYRYNKRGEKAENKRAKYR